MSRIREPGRPWLAVRGAFTALIAATLLVSCDVETSPSVEDTDTLSMGDLQSNDRDVRLAALKDLAAGETDAGTVVPLLTDFLGDDEFAPYAARVLGRLGEAARPAVPVLISALGSESSEVRASAEQALERLGSEAVPDLILTLKRQELEAESPLGSTWFGRLVQREPESVTVGLVVTSLAALVALVLIVKMWIGHRENLAKLGMETSAENPPEETTQEELSSRA